MSSRTVGRGAVRRRAVPWTLALALAALGACTPTPPTPTPPTPTPPTPTGPATAGPSPSSTPDDHADAPRDPDPAAAPTASPNLRWADGTEVVSTALDTGTARRLGADGLRIVRELESPVGTTLSIFDVGDDGSVLVAEDDLLETREDGTVVEEPTATVLKVVGPAGERVLTSDSERAQVAHGGHLASDGAVVWSVDEPSDAGGPVMYRAAAGQTRGVEVADPGDLVGLLDDGVVLADGTFRAWDGTTRDLGLPGSSLAGIVPVTCQHDTCPLILQTIEDLGDAGSGSLFGGAADGVARSSVSVVHDGVVTPVLTVDSSTMVVAAYEHWIVVADWGGDLTRSTWVVDTEERTALSLETSFGLGFAGSRLVWGASMRSTYTSDVEIRGSGDLHVFDVTTGDLTRIVLGEDVHWFQAAGDFIAWGRHTLFGESGREGVVARFAAEL